MGWLYHLNAGITHGLEGFLETAVPMIAGLAEVIGLFIIVTSLIKATYHYVRATFFHDHHDFHHEMSSGLTTALEFLMSAEIAKTFLLQNLESVVPLAATFALRAMMSLMLHWEMQGRTPLRPQKSRKTTQKRKRMTSAQLKTKFCQTFAVITFFAL